MRRKQNIQARLQATNAERIEQLTANLAQIEAQLGTMRETAAASTAERDKIKARCAALMEEREKVAKFNERVAGELAKLEEAEAARCALSDVSGGGL